MALDRQRSHFSFKMSSEGRFGFKSDIVVQEGKVSLSHVKRSVNPSEENTLPLVCGRLQRGKLVFGGPPLRPVMVDFPDSCPPESRDGHFARDPSRLKAHKNWSHANVVYHERAM